MWQGIEGHDSIVERFRRALQRNRLASTFLFVGPPGIGKRSFALALARALLCRAHPEQQLASCGQCESCVLAAAGTHPDVIQVARPKDRSFIPVAAFIGSDERRLKEGLCHQIALKPFMGGRRIAIIDDADYLNEEAANCLLKTLEEPPPSSVLILIGTSAGRQLPTIRSRCQIVRFAPLAVAVVARLLLQHQKVASPDEAQRLAEQSEGSFQRAVEMSDPAWRQFRAALFDQLATWPLDGLRLAEAVGGATDAAGKDAPSRRARLQAILADAAEFYRHLARRRAGAPASGDADLAAAVERGDHASRGDEQIAVDCVDVCLQALEYVDRNANQNSLIAWWADELMSAGGSLSSAAAG